MNTISNKNNKNCVIPMEIGTQAISGKVSLDTGLRRYDTKSMLPRFTSGFTFIELVVVISIVSIISSVLIFNYGSFDANIRLQNLAQDIALRIKEAQTVAMSGAYATEYNIQPLDDINLSSQAPTYGVYFNFNDEGITDRGFAFFADRPVSLGTPNEYNPSTIDGVISPTFRNSLCFNPGGSFEECLSVTKINSLDHISGIYYMGSAGVPIAPVADVLGVTFTRPWPTAHFSDGSGSDTPSGTEEVHIEIQSLRNTNKHKYVVVNRTGQISVKNGCAPGNPDINTSECEQ